MDCSPSGSSVHGIFRREYRNGLPFPSPGDLPNPGIELASPKSPELAGGFITTASPVSEEKTTVPVSLGLPPRLCLTHPQCFKRLYHHLSGSRAIPCPGSRAIPCPGSQAPMETSHLAFSSHALSCAQLGYSFPRPSLILVAYSF